MLANPCPPFSSGLILSNCSDANNHTFFQVLISDKIPPFNASRFSPASTAVYICVFPVWTSTTFHGVMIINITGSYDPDFLLDI